MSRAKNIFLPNAFRKSVPGKTVLCNRNENSNTNAQKGVDIETNELSSLYALPILLRVQDVANFWQLCSNYVTFLFLTILITFYTRPCIFRAFRKTARLLFKKFSSIYVHRVRFLRPPLDRNSGNQLFKKASTSKLYLKHVEIVAGTRRENNFLLG